MEAGASTEAVTGVGVQEAAGVGTQKSAEGEVGNGKPLQLAGGGL